MQNELEMILKDAETKLVDVHDKLTLTQTSALFLGKNGALSGLMKGLRELSNEEKRTMGEQLNILRDKLMTLFKDKEQEIETAILNEKLSKEKVDVTIPVKPAPYGTLHPIEALKKDLIDYFVQRGFELKDGTDIETDYYCFEALNVPKEHPAREMQDTFYIDKETVLRTHTSAMQVRTMESQQPPIKMISTGNAYRIDEVDATHSPIFGQ
ncbi:MAG: phenylalanine--tRNA ligase subunit alpha, partial [Clostridia bacterium]|nr:phenylalanine--tRNA ligase subunit alpha [Clostridia bacterium]